MVGSISGEQLKLALSAINKVKVRAKAWQRPLNICPVFHQLGGSAASKRVSCTPTCTHVPELRARSTPPAAWGFSMFSPGVLL